MTSSALLSSGSVSLPEDLENWRPVGALLDQRARCFCRISAKRRAGPVTAKPRLRSRAAHAVARVEEHAAVKTFWARGEKYHEQNIEAAGIILEREQELGGSTAGLVIWARLTLRHEAERQAAA
jgi:hypothetical protein